MSFSSRFKLGFRGGLVVRRSVVVVRRSVAVLRESPLSRLIAVARSVSWFLAVETFSFLHEFLMFGGHCVDIHGIRILRTRGVLVVSVLSIVLVESRVSSQGGHESSPVVVKEDGFVTPFFDHFRDLFHRHDAFHQFRFKGFLIEVDEDSMIGIVCRGNSCFSN